MTGALSPVMAASPPVAPPSITSPSPGMTSPALQMTTSPARSFDDDTGSIRPLSVTRFAVVSVFVFRSDSAWALPRASAIASANVAKRTVNQSQRSICSSKLMLPMPLITSRIRNSSTSAAPTSTTKMTGFFISVTGFSLRTESLSARRRISGSSSGRARTSFFGIKLDSSTGDGLIGGGDGGCIVAVAMAVSTPERKRHNHREELVLVHQEVLDDWRKGERGEERQRADDDDGRHEEPDEQGSVRRQRAGGGRHELLAREAAGDG